MEDIPGSKISIDINAIPKFTLEELEEALKDYYASNRIVMEQDFVDSAVYGSYRPAMKIYTGTGGADLFDESVEKEIGLSRVYIGKKVPRFLRVLGFTVRKNRSGRYYKLVKSPGVAL